MKSTERLIFHIDVNSAFLSWESARRVSQGLPDLREIPSCVGGDPKKRTGIVVAKSIPAKKYGIQTGEPVAMALRKCPNLVIVPSDFELYDKCSRAFKKICGSYAPVMESFSIDEVFLDMTGTSLIYPDPVAAAHELKSKIHRELGFTVNVGISTNKLLAKMASDFEKPDKVHTLFPAEIPTKMWPLPVDELFFVGSTDILPEPLSKEEEEKYVDMFQNGDLKARDKLIEHNLRLVVYLSKKYENTKVELEDLVSIGTIGLIKGINTYKNDKNIKLATYASRCIDNEILMYLRKNKKRKADVSLDESLSFDSEGNELHLEDILGTEKDIVTKDLEENDMRKIMLKEIGKLNERDKQIMVLRYGLNDTKEYTQKEVAELLGISQSYISRIEKKVISKISSMIKI